VPVGTGTAGDDEGIPRLVRDPRNQNPYAPLADDSGDEEAQVNTSHHNDVTGEDMRTYASVASSNSGSADADEQPSWSKLTPLPDAGMHQR